MTEAHTEEAAQICLADATGNVLDLGLDIQEAMDQPRTFAIDGFLQVEDGFSSNIYEQLQNRGHKLEYMEKPLGGSQAVWIDHDNGVLIGGSDPRKDGCALGF